MKQAALMLSLAFLAAGACKKDKSPDTPQPEVPVPFVDSFPGPAVSPEVPKDWAASQQQRAQAKRDYIAAHQDAYDWFANFAFSEKDGVPYLMLRLMPVLAPEIWGSEDNFLDVMGLFNDPRQPSYPWPRGVGFSGLARDDASGNIDYVSFTCGACHIGRVRRPDGTMEYLDGAINTEFNVAAYRTRIHKTLEKVYQGETSKLKKAEKARSAFLEALDTMHLRDKNFFYKNYSYGGRTFDAAYEAEQIELFKKKSLLVIPLYLLRAELELEAYVALVNKNYQGFEEQMLAGLGGMIDATGVNTGNVYILKVLENELVPFSHADPVMSLPPTPGLTDIMAVWEQGKRKAHWNEAQTELINGGGQWNGNIPIPIYRNLIAALTFGLIGTDVRVAAFGEELLDGLPATVYPFEVDTSLAEKGRALFQANCVGCHRPHNGTTYTNIGTDLSRSYVVDEPTAAAARKLLIAVCSPTTTVDLGKGDVKPCAEFAGVSLAGKESVVMSPVDQHLGYDALPLGGIWAQSPYLHNGSVPTLYHLLVVKERPGTFIKGRLDFDTEKVGYSWDPDASSNPMDRPYTFDATAFEAVSNRGHDQDITMEGKTYKLDWSDDIAGAKAIVEYMKTL